MTLKIGSLSVLFFFLFSCGKAKVQFDLFEDYKIIESVFFNDTLQDDKTKSYSADIRIRGNNYRWTRSYFEEDPYTNYPVLTDSITIDCDINSDFEVTAVNNWGYFYGRIKEYTDYMLANPSPEMADHIEELVDFIIDSTLVLNKNTKDLQIFSMAYHLYLDEDTSFTNQFITTYNDTSIISTLVFEGFELNQYLDYFEKLPGFELDELKGTCDYQELEVAQKYNSSISRLTYSTFFSFKDDKLVHQIEMILED